MNPKVTVLMPVYNAEKYLKTAIESILKQTFSDFELLIINDGSTDGSEEIIRSFNDKRIRLFNNEQNLGIIKTLNKGLNLAKGEYIIRMDADDISLPDRLELQVKYMEENPGIGISGTQARIFGDTKKFTIKNFTNPEEIKANLLFFCSVIHPSVITRKETFKKHNLQYSIEYKHAEDYELWSRAIWCTKIGNIPKTLIKYRVHNESISKKNKEEQSSNAKRIRRNLLKKLQLNPSEEEINLHSTLKKPAELSTEEFLNKKEAWLKKLITQNNKTKIFGEPYFSKVISAQWLDTCNTNAKDGFIVFKKMFSSPLFRKTSLNQYSTVAKVFIKTTKS